MGFDLIYASGQEPIPIGGACNPNANELVSILSSQVGVESECSVTYPRVSVGEVVLVI
jgi:hypothetical protein